MGSQEGSGKKGEGDGGDLSSDSALATGASPLPPLQELTPIHRRLVCGDGMGLAMQTWRTIKSSSDTSRGWSQPKLWGEEQE